MAATLTLFAPVSGLVVPLADVPDPAFAQRLVGDGVGIEPLDDTLVAPCDAIVRHVHRAGHAITLEVAGLEVVLHVGLDTVALAGAGFTVLVRAGDAVRAGTPLLRFDADRVARSARSLVTPVVVSNPERLIALEPASGLVTAGRDVLLRLTLAPRSIYLLRGAARWEWQHSVAPTKGLRYSITLRTPSAGGRRGRRRG